MKKLLLTLAAIFAIGITVKAETATFDFTTASSITAMNSTVAIPAASAGTNVNDVPFTVDGINIVGTQGTNTEARIWGTTSPGVYQYRLYAGAKLTISSTSETINKIVVSSNANGNISATNYSSGTWTGSANSVEFSVTGTIYISTIEVTFGEGGTVTPPVDPDPPTGPSGAVAFVADGASYDGEATVVTLSGNIPGTTFSASGICSFDMTKVNSSTSNVTGGQVRWYQGDVIKITPMSGVTITGITINSVTGNSAQDQIVNTSGIGEWSYNGLVATWTGSTNNALEFANSKQVRFTSIVVTYVRDEGSKKDAGLSFSSNAVTVKGLSATGFEPTLSKETTAIPSYTSSNTNVATVNEQGVVTLVYYGTTVITASVEETDVYAAGSTSYTLTVEPDGILTVKEALDLINKGYNGNAQVKGYISKIDEINTQYGNATYWIVDEKRTESPALEIYRGYSLNGAKFSAEDEIAVGGLVTVEGTILDYNGTPEFTTGSEIVSYEAPAEPAYSVTFKFTGVEDAYKYVGIIDMFNSNGPETLELTSDELVWKYDEMFVFNISPANPESEYTVSLSCDEEQSSSTYVIQTTNANGFNAYQLAVYPGADGYVFNVNVTKPATPEVTVNFTGAYKDNMKFAVNGMPVEITSDSYTIDLSDLEIDDYPYILSFQVPEEGYTVDVTGNMEQIQYTTWQDMPIGQGANGVNVAIYGTAAAGLILKVNVTGEAEEIPADAYVVYYDGEIASDLTQYDWWNADWNPKAMNPDGQGMALEIYAGNKTFDWGQGGYGGCSMGFSANNAMVVGPLHNGILTMEWTTVGNAKYTVRLTGGGKDYDMVINDPDAPAGTATWNTTTINVAEQFPELAAAWNVVTKGGPYVFGLVMENGEEGDAIYFNKIYYTNVDESWTVPPVPAPETVPAPGQPENMMLSVVSDNGSIQYSFGSWGQSTQAENTFIAGSPVIAMTDFTFLGLEFSAINVSDYDYMHVDYWTNSENTPFTFVPISLDPTLEGEPYKDSNVKANEWNSYDAPLSSFAANMEALRQIKFTTNVDGHDVTPYGYIANVYFWKEEVAEPNVLTLNIKGGDNAWQYVNVYNVVEEETVVLLENTYSVSNYPIGQVLSIQAKDGYEIEVTCATEGLVENEDYQIISQDQEGVVSYLIGMVKNDIDVIFDVTVSKRENKVMFEITGVENAYELVTMMDAMSEDGDEITVTEEPFYFTYPMEGTGIMIGVPEGYSFTVTTTNGPSGEDTYTFNTLGGMANEVSLGMLNLYAGANNYSFTINVIKNYELQLNITGGDDAWKNVNLVNFVDGETIELFSNTYTWKNYPLNKGILDISAKYGYEVKVSCVTEGLEADVDYQIQSLGADDAIEYVIGLFKASNVVFNVEVSERENKVMFEITGVENAYELVTMVDVMSEDGTDITVTEEPFSFTYPMTGAGVMIGVPEGYSFTVTTTNGPSGEDTYTFNLLGGMANEVSRGMLNLYAGANNYSFTINVTEVVDENMYVGVTTDGTAPTEYNKDYVLTTEDGGLTYTGKVKINAGESFNLWYNTKIQTADVDGGSSVNSFMPFGPATDEEVALTFTNWKKEFTTKVVLTTFGFWTIENDQTLELTINVDMERRTATIINNTELPAGQLNTLVFEDWEMKVSENMEDPATAEVPVSLDVEGTFVYQGFQFDINLPEGLEVTEVVANTALNGTASSSLFNAENNTYRVVVYSNWAEDGYTLTEDLVTLTVATTYPSEDGQATLIAAGDYDVTIDNIKFSDVRGNDVTKFENFEGTVTIVNMDVPATAVTISDAYLLEPSYNNIGSNLDAEGELAYVTAGQQVGLTITVDPANTTDELVVEADNGASVEFDEATGEWILDTTDATPGVVTVTATAGNQEATWTIVVKAIVLGDSNDNGTVNVADVVTTANFIVDNENDVFDWPNANVITNDDDVEGNVDGITVQDVTATVNIALGLPAEAQSMRRRTNSMNTNDRLVAENFRVVNGKPFVINVNLDNQKDYAALQAVVVIPEGMKVENVVTGPRAKNHRMSWNVSGNELKVVLFSMLNQSFLPIEGSLFDITVVANENCGNLSIEKIHASDASSNGYDLSFDGGLNESMTTAIDGIDAEEAGVEYYTLDGIRIQNPEKGQILIRVQNGEASKVLVE